MIKEIIGELESNSTLLSLLKATQTDKHIYAKHTDYLGDCIIYESYGVAADKVKETQRLTITIVASTLSLTHQIEKEIKRSILTLADNPLTNNILQVGLTGGGSLYDYDRQKHHTNLYFTLTTRSEI